MDAKTAGTLPKEAAKNATQPIKDEEFANYVPKGVDSIDAMSPALNAETWQKVYTAVKASNEGEYKAVRCGVYVYCVVNGCSQKSEFSGDVVTADGKRFPASVIAVAATRQMVRRFLRANMEEAYRFLKNTRVIESYPRYVSRVSTKGIKSSEAFATADFLRDCPLFTPAEQDAHNRYQTFSVDRARHARGGKTIDDLTEEGNRAVLAAQGSVGPEPTSW